MREGVLTSEGYLRSMHSLTAMNKGIPHDQVREPGTKNDTVLDDSNGYAKILVRLLSLLV